MKCKKDKDCILEALYATKNYEGVSGIITIASDGIAKKDFVLKEVKNGGFIEVN